MLSIDKLASFLMTFCITCWYFSFIWGCFRVAPAGFGIAGDETVKAALLPAVPQFGAGRAPSAAFGRAPGLPVSLWPARAPPPGSGVCASSLTAISLPAVGELTSGSAGFGNSRNELTRAAVFLMIFLAASPKDRATPNSAAVSGRRSVSPASDTFAELLKPALPLSTVSMATAAAVFSVFTSAKVLITALQVDLGALVSVACILNDLGLTSSL